ncbi:hypothetical protein HID58_014866, partial [Brassica napus]
DDLSKLSFLRIVLKDHLNLLLLLYAICNSWYNLVKEVGDATFGNVWRAVNKLTGEVLSCFSREIKSSTLFVFDFRNLMSEIGAFKCLSCMHQRGYFHSREVNSSPPYTVYVSTRWYKEPKVPTRVICVHVKIWLGAILPKMLSLRPLFPGARSKNKPAICLFNVCSVIGIPTEEAWLEGL